MCKMNTQTQDLLAGIRPATPLIVADLLAAYAAPTPAEALDLNLYAEPYYGNYNKCSLVLLTHNPGDSTAAAKGIGSPFDHAINNPPLPREDNYFNIATALGFPNRGTNNWVNKRNIELQNHFNGIIRFNQKLFIRDLIPYHSKKFGIINMTLCTKYFYRYFLSQVIKASFSSELHENLNAKNTKPATIIYARGGAWKGILGLVAIGWDFVGRIYRNCYIYKANFATIQKNKEFSINNYPPNLLDHDIYIVVITQVRSGAPFGIYINNRAPLTPIPLSGVLYNYYNVKQSTDPKYISHSEMMNDFFDIISHLRDL